MNAHVIVLSMDCPAIRVDRPWSAAIVFTDLPDGCTVRLEAGMGLVRIATAKPLDGYKVELVLSTGEVIQRDMEHLLNGPVFDEIRTDERRFRELRAEGGTIVWPNGADVCPDVIIWSGLPPANACSSAA